MKYADVELHNVWDIEETDDRPGIRLSRLPLTILPEVNEGVQWGTYLPAASEIRGMLPPGGKATVVLQVDDENLNPPFAETFFGCMHACTTLLSKEPTEVLIVAPNDMQPFADIHQRGNYPFDSALVRVKLPPLHNCRIISIEGDLTYPEPNTTPATTMLAYGSSITHGAHAVRPTGTYAAQAARHLDADLINLGFGGSAQMEDAIARHIATRNDWDFATLEMGINVTNWPTDRFHEAVDNFVSTIASGQPENFVFCIDLFTHVGDLTGIAEMAPGFREAVKMVVEKQNSNKVIYIDGREILMDPVGLMLDLVHPADDGMQEMGRNLATRIKKERNHA